MGMAYHICRTIEILVLYLAGYRLLTQGYELRWDKVWVKILIAIIYGLWMISAIVNAWIICKFAGVEYIFAMIITIVIVTIFYQCSVLSVVVSSMALWINACYFHVIIEVVAAFEAGETNIEVYNYDFSKYYVSEIAGMVLFILGLIGLLWIKNGKRTIEFLSHREKGFLFIVITAEMVLIDSLLDERSLLAFCLFTSLAVCIVVLFYLYHAYKNRQMEIQMISTRNKIVEEQFDTLESLYQEKRIQIHDTVQKNILLQGYLKSGKYEDAENFLEEMKKDSACTAIHAETGILEIDLMLYHKRRVMLENNVCLEAELDVIVCPLQRKDICILLGNLLDNALDAVQELPEGNRKVELRIKSVNQMFLLRISNRYVGERKCRNGKYFTTKKEKDIHGLGLESCRKIVESYGGDLEIVDKAGQFTVGLLIS